MTMFLALALALLQTDVLESTPLIRVEEPLRDLTVDTSGKFLVTLDNGRVRGWKRDERYQESWSTIHAGAAAAVVCNERDLVVFLRLPYVETYDFRTGEKHVDIAGSQEGEVQGAVSSPTGKWVWCGAADGVVRMAERDPWKRLELGNGGVTVLALSEDSRRLAVGGRDGTVRFVDTEEVALEKREPLRVSEAAITALAFGPRVLVAAAEDGALRAWRANQLDEVFALQGGEGVARVVQLEPCTTSFACGEIKGDVTLRSWKDGQPMGRWVGAEEAPVAAMAYLAREKKLLVAVKAQVLELKVP
jgi:WD40 repeat protein